MRTLQWMSAASRRPVTLAKPGVGTVTIAPRPDRGWTVTRRGHSVRKDQIGLEDMFERLAFQGWREALS